jgi:imidazolonepropionase-like amidohydrolase
MARLAAIKVAALIDGTGRAPLREQEMLIREGRIESILGWEQAPAPPASQAQWLDASHLWALPGLIDSHVHLNLSAGERPMTDFLREDQETLQLRSMGNAQHALVCGITTVRDCGSRGSTVLSLRAAIDSGLLTGPRIVVSGEPITTTGGHAYWLGGEADGETEVRKAARLLMRQGVDFIKIMGTGGGMTRGTNARAAQYSLSEMQAIVAECRRLGRLVAAHVHGTEGIRNAVEAGVHALEHCSWLGAGEGLEYDERLVDRMACQGTFVNPTLIAGYHAFTKGTDLTPDRARLFGLRQGRIENLRRMIRAGVRILAGTDAGTSLTPAETFAENLGMLQHDLGMPAMDVLQSATRISAEALGISAEVGTLEPGKRADLILIEGNPLDDLDVLSRVRWVIRDGRVVARDGSLVLGN